MCCQPNHILFLRKRQSWLQTCCPRLRETPPYMLCSGASLPIACHPSSCSSSFLRCWAQVVRHPRSHTLGVHRPHTTCAATWTEPVWEVRLQQGVTHITLVTIITKETKRHLILAHRVNRDKMRLIFAVTCFFKLSCVADSPWSTDVSKEVRSLEVAWP